MRIAMNDVYMYYRCSYIGSTSYDVCPPYYVNPVLNACASGVFLPLMFIKSNQFPIFSLNLPLGYLYIYRSCNLWTNAVTGICAAPCVNMFTEGTSFTHNHVESGQPWTVLYSWSVLASPHKTSRYLFFGVFTLLLLLLGIWDLIHFMNIGMCGISPSQSCH